MSKKKKKKSAKKAAKKAKGSKKRKSAESHLDAKLSKALDNAEIRSGFMSFQVHGDSVGGEVLAIEDKKGRYGPQKLVTVKTAEGSQSFYATKVLETFIEENDVCVGDTLAVRYVEDRPSGKGAPAKIFKIVYVPAGKPKRKK